MVGAAGFEPATLWSQTRCATRLRYAPIDVLIQYILIFSKDKEHLIQEILVRIRYITNNDN